MVLLIGLGHILQVTLSRGMGECNVYWLQCKLKKINCTAFGKAKWRFLWCRGGCFVLGGDHVKFGHEQGTCESKHINPSVWALSQHSM